jgi:hypothetical protein
MLLFSFQPVRSMLSRIRPASHRNQPAALSPAGGTPEEWRKAPALSQGPNKKYPHLSKAVEVRQNYFVYTVRNMDKIRE